MAVAREITITDLEVIAYKKIHHFGVRPSQMISCYRKHIGQSLTISALDRTGPTRNFPRT